MSISLQTLMPSVVTPNTQILVTDIDGDGINEVIMLDGNLEQLSICHQFNFSQISLSSISSIWSSTTPIWPNNTSLHWITDWGVSAGAIPTPQGATFGAWQLGFDDVIMAADLDGDGIDELFIYSLSSLTWGVLKWQSNQLQTIARLSVAPGAGASSVNPPLIPVTWHGSDADQFFVVPNLSSIMPSVTQHAAGILVYNSETYALAMIAYASGSFSEPWNTTQTTLPGGWKLNGNSPQPTINEFMPGFFATAGVPSIAVYSPSTAYIALLQWDPQQKQFVSSPGQGHQAGNWSFGSEDKHHVADLDGDGMSEMFVYAPNDGYIGVLKWVSGSFQSYAITNSQIGSGQNQWSPGKASGSGKDKQENHYFCLNGSQNTPGQIYAFSPNGGPSNAPQVALLYYSNQNFNCAWAGSSLSSNNGWPVTAEDTFYAGPSWDAASPKLITLSNQGPSASPVLTLGAASWNGTNLTSGQVQLVSSQTVPIPSWSPAGLANAPHTAFPQWPSVSQQQIYAYISQLFPIPGATNPSATNDVRSLYTSAGDSNKWETYADALEKVTMPSQIPAYWPQPPANNNWSNSDWTAVVGTIANECNEVDTAYSMYGDMGSLTADFSVYQQQDLTTVKLNIKQAGAVNPESEIAYWIGHIAVDFLWILAAAMAVFAVASVALAAAAATLTSTIAAALGEFVNYNPKRVESFAEAEAEQQILTTTSNSIVSNSLDLTAILTDPVKMMILDGLHDNVWQMTTSLPSTVKQPFQLMDRLWMYQQLLPFYFSIDVYKPGANPDSSNSPTYSANNVNYFLKDQNGYISASQFSGTTLYSDLFTTIGVTEVDFFAGHGGWSSIPRQVFKQPEQTALSASGD